MLRRNQNYPRQYGYRQRWKSNSLIRVVRPARAVVCRQRQDSLVVQRLGMFQVVVQSLALSRMVVAFATIVHMQRSRSRIVRRQVDYYVPRQVCGGLITVVILTLLGVVESGTDITHSVVHSAHWRRHSTSGCVRGLSWRRLLPRPAASRSWSSRYGVQRRIYPPRALGRCANGVGLVLGPPEALEVLSERSVPFVQQADKHIGSPASFPVKMPV